MLIPLGMSLSIHVPGNIYFSIYLPYFLYLYIFFIGLLNKQNNLKYIVKFTTILTITTWIISFNGYFKAPYLSAYIFYTSIDSIISIIFVYLIGFQYAKNTNRDNLSYTILEYLILLLLILYIFIPFYFSNSILNMIFKHYTLSFSSIFIAIYIGLKYKYKGIFFALVWMYISFIILTVYNLDIKNTIIEKEYFTILPVLKLSDYIFFILFMIFGSLSINIRNHDSYDKYIIKATNANNIKRLYLFLITFFPIIIILTFLYYIYTLNGNFTKELIEILIEGRNKGVYVAFFFFVMIYLLITYLPILISEGIIRRNGVVFNQVNFPKYVKIHDLLDVEFGKDRRDLYLISPNRIVLFEYFTNRVFKIYSALNPSLLSPVYNEITKYDDEKLLFHVYRQYSKIKLGHVKLWWYMYILTFIPILNVLYFYAKRLTYQNATLYTINKLDEKNLITHSNVIDALVTEETEAGVQNISKNEVKINGIRNIFFLWLEYMTSRPHLQTQLYLVNSFYKIKSKLQIVETKMGYNFK
jgi:hypothetical protein